MALPTQRQAYRRTDDYTPGAPKLRLVTESLPATLDPTSVLIQVHAVSLNYRDANISNGGNPWPVTPNGIICNDAAGEIIAVGDKVKRFSVGDRVAPTVDTEYITDRSTGRSWLAANEDGVLATHLVYDQQVIVKLPTYLSWENACLIPCAGVTAWAALRGVGIGKSILIQGTGGVSSWALKLAKASGMRIILTSSSDQKIAQVQKVFAPHPIAGVNYSKTPDWHEEVLKLTSGVGVDLVLENGGASSLVKSIKCTRRGGIVSQVGYLGKQNPQDLTELVSTIIDRRVILRGINAGSTFDMEDLSAALEATEMRLDDIIDTVYPWEKAEEALQSLWEGKVVGKLVIRVP